ncbi:hypothetical protein ASG36_16480 [Geodermatophilus sp. Leaf369]|uniref:recombinase family protein n=1 Tax=Geodermatophilus sp. Leaf369 TaxID=1736354 RepID=UPI0006F66050|nr:recombinase family protein [Geodermatophilus sp. Leaf369]KQS56661.1 hypothetical protein ASG36_16480 [Geodermatophilus sp. Leaf369]
MTTPSSAAIYARISSDQAGEGLGVQRQLEDCRKLAAELGWQVGREYIDNDVSAYSGKPRPAYLQMLTDISSGDRDGVLVYHQDRLTRRPLELEEFAAVVDAAQLRHVRFVSGASQLGAGDGLLVARIMGAVAAEESAAKSRRVKRKLLQNAERGLPHGRSVRPFGFDDDAITHRPAEVALLRELAARFIAGESLRSLCTDLDRRGERTVKGAPWQTHSLRYILSNPRIAGQRVHNGEVLGPAVWAPILDEATFRKVVTTIEGRRASGRRAPRRYLLSGLLRCGKCGGKLFASPRADSRRYVCLSGPDHRGCGKLTITAPPLEELVIAYVLHRLDSPALADSIAGRSASDAEAAALTVQLAADQDRLDYLARQWAAKKISTREWEQARTVVEGQVKAVQRQLSQLTGTDALTGLGVGGELRSRWTGLNLDRQAAIVRTLITHITIGPGTPGARSLNPDRAEVAWRL